MHVSENLLSGFSVLFLIIYLVTWLVCNRRKSGICSAKSDDSSSGSEDDKTTARPHWTTSKHHVRTTCNGHQAKVVRKSRKSRQLKAASLNCKQTSVSVETERKDVMMIGPQQPQPTCDNRLVSTSTQTDDVIVINVSQQLHATSDVSERLFSFSHGVLLPTIRVSDVHPVPCDRDTDSGHMSDAENKLTSPSELIDNNCERLSNEKDMARSTYHGSKEVIGTVGVQDVPPLVAHGSFQQDKAIAAQSKTSAAVSRELSSAEHGHLSRWTTATRLNILDQSDEGRVHAHPETFFASLETSNHQQTASTDADVSGISALSSHRRSNLPMRSSRISSANSQTKSSEAVHRDVLVSNHSGSQSSVGTPYPVSKVSRQSCGKTRPSNSSRANVSRPSAGARCRMSKGTRQSRGTPRLSVGRKSLSQRQTPAVRDKCQLSTKISRPAAWLMSATRGGRSKVLVQCFVFRTPFTHLSVSEVFLLEYQLTEC